MRAGAARSVEAGGGAAGVGEVTGDELRARLGVEGTDGKIVGDRIVDNVLEDVVGALTVVVSVVLDVDFIAVGGHDCAEEPAGFDEVGDGVSVVEGELAQGVASLLRRDDRLSDDSRFCKSVRSKFSYVNSHGESHCWLT